MKTFKLSNDPQFVEKLTNVVGLCMNPPEHALDVLKGEVLGQFMKRHRHEEVLKFLKTIDRVTTSDLNIHFIADNYATHQKQEIRTWLESTHAFSSTSFRRPRPG